MTTSSPLPRCLAGALGLALNASAFAADPPRESIAPAFAHAIENAPGKAMTALIVTYPPGGKTPSHRHGGAFVIAYVLEGSIRSQVDNGEAKVYRAGESWTEKPGAHHRVSENASATEPAKLLAILVADADAKDLLVFDGDAVKK